MNVFEKIHIAFNIINHMQAVITVIAAAWGISYLCMQFAVEKRRVLWLVSVPYMVVDLTETFLFPNIIDSFLLNLIGISASFVLFYFLDKRNPRQKIFLAVTFFTVKWIVFSLYVWLSMSARIRLTDLVWSRLDQSDINIWKPVAAWNSATAILGGVILAVMVNAAMRLIAGAYRFKGRELRVRELFVLSMPSFVGMASYAIMHTYTIGDDGTVTNFMLTDARPATKIMWVAYDLFLFTAIMMTITAQQRLIEQQEKEQRELVLTKSVEDIKAHIAEVEGLYARIGSVRHEVKNHVTVLTELLALDKIDEAKDYLGSFAGTTEAIEFPVKTGNPVTDVIISERMAEAEKLGINFASDFHYPVGTDIDAFDISIIISNALSNALEAVVSSLQGGGGNIVISSFRKKKAYFIRVDNSFSGELLTDDNTGLPTTTKDDRTAHGIGLLNVKAVAEKYNGDIIIAQDKEQQGNVVRLTVMLMTEI